jgi:segregation and condensation protein B
VADRKRGRARAQAEPAETAGASLDDLVAALDDAKERGRAAQRGEPAPVPVDDDEDGDVVATPMADDDDVQLSDALPMAEDDDLSAVEGEASPRLVSIVESLLFAATKPLGVRELRSVLKEASIRQIQLALKQLSAELGERGVVLAQVASGFRLRTNPENARWVQLLLADKPARLSRSQLETLAVIAYRQPITKPEIDHVRGVDCAAVLKILLDRDLVRIVGRKEEPGRPQLYGTTVRFLEFFNLRSLRDMPDLHEFRELTEESLAIVREELGESALFEEREAMGQEVLDLRGEAESESESESESVSESESESESGPEAEAEADSDSEADSETDSDSDSDK